MRHVISESPDRKMRIIIDPSSETVTFINCHILTPPSFFTLRILRQAEVVCPFADILDVYDLHNMRKNWILRGPPLKVSRIATTNGNACFSADWSNSDEARRALREVSASTSSPPALRNPNVGVLLLFVGCSVAAAFLIGLYFWLTGE